MIQNGKVWCPHDGRSLGKVPVKLLWTGSVERMPEEADLLTYYPCATCRSHGRPMWQRYEVAPPDPDIGVIVPIKIEAA